MSWAQWPQAGVPQPPPTPANSAPASVAPPAPGNPAAGAAYSPAIPPPTSYTPNQYAAMPTDQQYAIQQNWQQWQTYHQQYAQWHAQYGEQYQREMQAKLGMVAPSLPFVPPMPPSYAAPIPPATPGPASYSVPPPPPSQTTNIPNTPNITAAASQPPPPPPPPEENPGEKDMSFGNQKTEERSSDIKPNSDLQNPIGPQMPRDLNEQKEMQNQQQQDYFQQRQQPQQNRGQFEQQPQQNRAQFEQQSQQNRAPFEQQSQQNRAPFEQQYQQNRPPPQFEQQFQQNRPPFEQQSQQWKSNNDSRNFNERRSFGGNDRDRDRDRNRNNFGDNFGNRNSRGDWNRNDNDNRGRNPWQQQQSFRDNPQNQQMQQQQTFRDNPQNQQMQQQSPFKDNPQNQQMQQQQSFRDNQPQQSFRDNQQTQMQSPQKSQQINPIPKLDSQNYDQDDDGDEKTPEEKAFDEQFRKWEEQFENWKKQNANHPDRKAYKEYEMKFEDCRRKLLERREVMKKRKLERKMKEEEERQMRERERNPIPERIPNIEDNVKAQPPGPGSGPNEQIDNMAAFKEPEEKMEMEMKHEDDVQIVEPEPEPKEMHDKDISGSTEQEQVEFLKTTKSDGIPGLDLVSESEVADKKVDDDVAVVIDLEADAKGDRTTEKATPISDKIPGFKKTFTENIPVNTDALQRPSFAMTEGEEIKMKREIPSLLSQVFDKPVLSPPHGEKPMPENFGGDQNITVQGMPQMEFIQKQDSKETFGNFLEKNAPVAPSAPVTDANITNQPIQPEGGASGDKGNVPTGIAELANALSDPNVLALITAAMGGNAGPGVLANADIQGALSKVSPWAMGQLPFQNQNPISQNQFRGQQQGDIFRDPQGGNFRDNPGGNFRDSQGGNFRDSQGGNFRDSPGGNFRDSQGGNFRDSQGGNFRDSLGGNFRDSLGGNFRDTQGGNFRGDSQGGNFRDSQGGNFRDSPGGNFRDSQGGNFRDSQGGNFRDSPRGNFRDSQGGNFRDFGNQNNMNPWQDKSPGQNTSWSNRNMGDNRGNINPWQNRSNRQDDFRRGGNQGGWQGGRNMGDRNNAPWQDDVDMRSNSLERNNSADIGDERSKSSERIDRGEKVNPFKDRDDRGGGGGGRANPFSDSDDRGRGNQSGNRDRSRSGNRNSRDRSRSSGRSGPGRQGENSSQGGFQRNPFKPESNVFDKPLDSPNQGRNAGGNGGGGDVGNEPFFRPAHVIDYQNKPLGDSGQNDVLLPCKVVDYGHKPSGNNNDQTENTDFFPMKTIDYGHSSAAKPDPDNGNNFEGRKTDFAGKNRNRNRNRNNKKRSGLQESNPTYPGLWSLTNEQSRQRPGLPTKRGKRKKSCCDERNYPLIDLENDIHLSVEPPTTTNECRENFEEISEDDNDFDESAFRNPDFDESAFRKPDFDESAFRNTDFDESAFRNPDYEEFNAVDTPVLEETKPSPVFPIKETTFSAELEKKVQLIIPTMENNNTITIDEILLKPGRESRPKKIVIILRGPPGSGKSYVAKLIKEKEVEMGGSTPRLLSIDDYFMTEVDKEGKCPNTGRKVVTKEMVYEYEKEMEDSYMQYLIKAFKKTVNDRLYEFVIVDCVNQSLRTFTEFYNNAKSAQFTPYTIDLLCDIDTCLCRNIHDRSEEDIQSILDNWVPTPDHYIKLDVTSLIQSVDIQEVEMEDISDMEEAAVDESDADQYNEEGRNFLIESKWDTDTTEEKLARLDGTSKRPHKSVTLEDYLQMDGWEPPPSSSTNKKRVRWADIEEKRAQDKMRAIGFVVGQTDWSRMMDPTGGSSALTKTKYIEKVNKRK